MTQQLTVCYLCGSNKRHERPGSVRDDSTLNVLECDECGLVYLSRIDHIQNAHYEESGMHGDEVPDEEAWLHETDADDTRRFQFLKTRIVNKRVLDFGCGVGGFLNKARTVAATIAGVEPERALDQSFAKRNLKVWGNHKQIKNKNQWDLITAFHVVEHLPDPVSILNELSVLLAVGGEIIIEVPSADDALLTLYESKPFQNFTYWSQHLYLFNRHTLYKLAQKAGLQVRWMQYIQRYSISNHLYWMAKGKPGGHQQWAFLEDEILQRAYESRLAALGLTDTLVAGLIRK